MAKHGYQKNSIRAKINHELWKGVRFDFSSSLQMTKLEGGGSLGRHAEADHPAARDGGEPGLTMTWSTRTLLMRMEDIPGSSGYDANNPLLNNRAYYQREIYPHGYGERRFGV